MYIFIKVRSVSCRYGWKVEDTVKKMYNFGGQEIPGEEVEFEVEHEGFNVYILHDGTRLKFKAVVGQIVRLDAYKPDGEPVYMINATNIAVAAVPDSLKRKPGETQ